MGLTTAFLQVTLSKCPGDQRDASDWLHGDATFPMKTNDSSERIRACGQAKLNAHLFGEERVQETLSRIEEVALLTGPGAWRIARNELTMRPLLQPQLSISSKLIARANDSSRVVSEFREDTKREVELTSWHPTRLAPSDQSVMMAIYY